MALRPAVSCGLLLSNAKDLTGFRPSARAPFGGPAISAWVDLRRPVGFASRLCSRFAFIGSEKNHFLLCRFGKNASLREIRERRNTRKEKYEKGEIRESGEP